MAPSRRKGASKAAAAAAARRQWKVGDLVLAKVKGFPAWPATVSEPEKWGYSADWKKVLVFFFGTQQIAFCNPADVEAFTEEKKQSLLTKRQGRGADFVRAVQEIIDSYEKLKKQDQVDSNSGDELTVANGGNSVNSISHLKDRTEASEATLDSQMKPSNSTAGDGLNLPTEDSPAGRQLDALPAKEPLPEQPSENLVAKATPVLTTYSSRKRSGGSRLQSTQRMAPSTRRSRSSTMVESCRLQNLMMPYNNEGKNAEGISAKGILDGSLIRNKRTRKSPDGSECNDMDSSALMSNGSIEDNSSEIVTVESDAFSLNEGSTVDSGCKVEDSETVLECLDGDEMLSKRLDFQIKAVVVKKKRKPNRKRVCNDAVDPPARINTATEVDVSTRNTCHSSENTGGNLDERDFKEDGDEHLPLVKRARVRMGKPSSEEELKSSLQTEEKPSKDAAVNLVEHISPSLNNDDEGFTEKGPSLVKESTDSVSPSKVCSEVSGTRPQLWKGTTNQSFGCSADGEAALPPSKRLHRALEAMSANAAEEGQASVQASSLINTSINGCCVNSICKCSHETVDSRERSGSGLQNVPTCDQLSENCNSHKQESFRDDVGSVDNVDGKDLPGSPLSVHTIQTAVQTQTPVNILPDPKKRHSSFQLYQNSLDQLSLKDEGSAEDLQLKDSRVENVDKEFNTSALAELSLDPVSGADESVKLSPQNGSNELQYSVQGMSYENSESLKSQIDDNCHINARCEAVEEIKQNEKQKEMSSVSISDDHLGDKGVASVLFSSSPAEGVDSPARVSPPNTLLCHVSTSESANIVQSSSSSPYARSQYKKLGAPVADEGKVDTTVTQRPKSVGKWSSCSEAHAALSSFEAVLGSLTRTKESIGRATRIAIECAKFGVSSKVVEIVARHLESESSLYRRVDLFFLVDSIMQCSRGMKGDVSGIFPSAILTVLPRLLSAAAPPGNVAQENRRQCLKVLRLWLERRILPESIIRHHMRELDTVTCSSSAVAYSRRSSRTERALDDPVRDMEGMLVDEYGSNSSFQLPGFCMPRMLKDDDDGSDSDGGSFEAVTPEHNSEIPEERDANPSMKKHRHILEEVDGELEMEDVAPTCDNEMSSTVLVDIAQTSHDQLLSFVPPLPQDVPPSSPPLPSSPPPVLPPPPSIPHSCAFSDSYSNGASMQNMQNDAQQSVTQQSVAPRINSTVSTNAVHYHASECRDHQMPMQMPESTSSFGCYSMCPSNNFQQTDGPKFHNKPYPPRPPHAPQSNHFSYVQASQSAKSRREAPHPSNSHRFHPHPNFDGGNFYNNHDRMKPGPYEHRESWRFSAPSFSGPRYPDEARECYPSGSYGGPLREPPRYSNRGWAYPPRPMNHRHMRPPSGGAVPVGIRAPGAWRPR